MSLAALNAGRTHAACKTFWRAFRLCDAAPMSTKALGTDIAILPATRFLHEPRDRIPIVPAECHRRDPP
jgi:hypothetical protein